MLDLLFYDFFLWSTTRFLLLTSSNNFNPLKHVVKTKISCNLGNKIKSVSKKVNKKKQIWIQVPTGSLLLKQPLQKIGIPIKSPTKKLKHKWICGHQQSSIRYLYSEDFDLLIQWLAKNKKSPPNGGLIVIYHGR